MPWTSEIPFIKNLVKAYSMSRPSAIRPTKETRTVLSDRPSLWFTYKIFWTSFSKKRSSLSAGTFSNKNRSNSISKIFSTKGWSNSSYSKGLFRFKKIWTNRLRNGRKLRRVYKVSRSNKFIMKS